jgi:hypothetical protein
MLAESRFGCGFTVGMLAMFDEDANQVRRGDRMGAGNPMDFRVPGRRSDAVANRAWRE